MLAAVTLYYQPWPKPQLGSTSYYSFGRDVNWHKHMAPFQSDYPVTSHQCYPSHQILASFLSPAPGTADNSSWINKHPLPPHTPLLTHHPHSMGSIRQGILFCLLKNQDWKTVQNQAWLGLFIQLPFPAQSGAESPCEQHPWSSHPLQGRPSLGTLPAPPPLLHPPPWRLLNSF